MHDFLIAQLVYSDTDWHSIKGIDGAGFYKQTRKNADNTPGQIIDFSEISMRRPDVIVNEITIISL